MVDKNDPLFREIDEELRREQWAKLWERYGTYFIGAAALIVVLVGGFKLWEARQLALAQAGGAQYETALELAQSGKPDAAEKALQELAASGSKGYMTLAELLLAGSKLKAERPQDALAQFEKLAQDRSADTLLSGYASLQAAALRIDEAPFDEMKQRLAPLAGDDSPWRYNARELLGLAALKAGKLDEARGALAPLLADASVPRGTAERVRVMMAEITASELKQGAAAAPAAAASDAAPAKE